MWSRPIFVVFFFLLISIAPVFAASNLEINISEQGKIISFYDDYFIVNVNGSISITNPSKSDLYNIQLPLYMGTLELRTDNNTNHAHITSNVVSILNLPSNSSVRFDYTIVGITSEDFNKNGKSILYNSVNYQSPKIYSNVMGALQKAPLEDPDLTGNAHQRLVSVELYNPTGFEFNIGLMKVIKTREMDPDSPLDTWDFTAEKNRIRAGENYSYDLLDDNAYEGEIYWLQSDIYIDEITVMSNENISRLSQDDLFIPLDNDTNITFNDSELDFIEKRVFIRKLVSSTRVNPGDYLNLTMIVNNFGSNTLSGVLTDLLPQGFEIIRSFTKNDSLLNNGIKWDLSILPRNAKRFMYEVMFVDQETVGLDFFDAAVLDYGQYKSYSSVIPFVRQYVPEKKVYIQKSLDFKDDGDVEVVIAVRNLGETSLNNLIVKEYLDVDNEFKEISKPFDDKGVWSVDQLKPGEIWKTSYVTDTTNVLNTFPELYGVPKSNVFQNIVMKNIVESSFKILDVSTFELMGIGVLILLLLTYIIPHGTLRSMKRKMSKDLVSSKLELDRLKNSSKRLDSVSSVEPAMSEEHKRNVEKEILRRSDDERQKKIEDTQKILDDIKQKLDR